MLVVTAARRLAFHTSTFPAVSSIIANRVFRGPLVNLVRGPVEKLFSVSRLG